MTHSDEAGELHSGHHVMREAFAGLEANFTRESPDRRPIFATLSELDATTGGFFPGDLVVIAGRTRDDLRALALRLLREHSRARGTTVYHCLSEPLRSLGVDLISSATGMHRLPLARGLIDKAEWGNIASVAAGLADQDWSVGVSRDLDDIVRVSTAVDTATQEGPRLVVVDDLARVRVKDGDDRARIGAALARLAEDTQAVVVVLHLLTTGETGPPALADVTSLREVQHHARMVLLLDRPATPVDPPDAASRIRVQVFGSQVRLGEVLVERSPGSLSMVNHHEPFDLDLGEAPFRSAAVIDACLGRGTIGSILQTIMQSKEVNGISISTLLSHPLLGPERREEVEKYLDGGLQVAVIGSTVCRRVHEAWEWIDLRRCVDDDARELSTAIDVLFDQSADAPDFRWTALVNLMARHCREFAWWDDGTVAGPGWVVKTPRTGGILQTSFARTPGVKHPDPRRWLGAAGARRAHVVPGASRIVRVLPDDGAGEPVRIRHALLEGLLACFGGSSSDHGAVELYAGGHLDPVVLIVEGQRRAAVRPVEWG